MPPESRKALYNLSNLTPVFGLVCHIPSPWNDLHPQRSPQALPLAELNLLVPGVGMASNVMGWEKQWWTRLGFEPRPPDDRPESLVRCSTYLVIKGACIWTGLTITHVLSWHGYLDRHSHQKPRDLLPILNKPWDHIFIKNGSNVLHKYLGTDSWRQYS